MELEKFDRQLRLMVCLTQNRHLSIDAIGQELHMSRRSIYRYIDSFKQMGFLVKKEGGYYRIDHDSPFFKQITERIHFSEEEAITINQVLNSVVDNTPQVRALRDKLSNLYDYGVMARHGVDDAVARNIGMLFKAMQQERVAVLHDYESANSGTCTDRIVEPYLFLAGNSEVRCLEVSSGQNKTFKIGRIGMVELLGVRWMHKDKHRPYFTDLFHFSGEQRISVKLLMGTLATSLLLEEHPDAERHITSAADGRHLLSTQVCSLKGVGRFVLGLYDDIEVLDSPELEDYLRQQTQHLTEKFGV